MVVLRYNGRIKIEEFSDRNIEEKISRCNKFIYLGTLKKFRKFAISFFTSVCLFVLMDKLGSQLMDFHEIWYLNIFQKSVEKIQVSFITEKNSRYFSWRSIYSYDHISLIFSYNEKYFG